MNPFAMSLEHASHRILGKPVNLEIRNQFPKLLGDGHVTARVAQADRR